MNLHAHALGVPRQVQPNSEMVNNKVPDFTLLNEEGDHFDSTKLRGKVVAVNFIFTTCSDDCPMFTADLAQLQRVVKNGHAGEPVFR